jgi:hypothetical protein
MHEKTDTGIRKKTKEREELKQAVKLKERKKKRRRLEENKEKELLSRAMTQELDLH